MASQPTPTRHHGIQSDRCSCDQLTRLGAPGRNGRAIVPSTGVGLALFRRRPHATQIDPLSSRRRPAGDPPRTHRRRTWLLWRSYGAVARHRRKRCQSCRHSRGWPFYRSRLERWGRTAAIPQTAKATRTATKVASFQRPCTVIAIWERFAKPPIARVVQTPLACRKPGIWRDAPPAHRPQLRQGNRYLRLTSQPP